MNQPTFRFRVSRARSKVSAATIVFVVAFFGAWLVLSSHAAISTIVLEPENGLLAGSATATTNAQASGGKAVKFLAISSSSSFPDATNTGVPTGTTLTPYSGKYTISTAGAVVSGLDITGQLDIEASNVTVKNCRIRGTGVTNVVNLGDGVSGFTIQDCEIDGQGTSENGIGWGGYTMLRVNLHDTFGDGAKAETSTTIKDSYIHGFDPTSSTHNDGIQTSVGSNILIQHNTIVIDYGAHMGAQSSIGPTQNSAIFIKADQGPIDNITVSGNLLAGGGYTLYGGTTSTPYSPATSVSITGNTFSKRIWPKSGYYGPIVDANLSDLTGNAWEDGTSIP